MHNARNLLGKQVSYAESARDALRGSECAFIATAWDEFKRLRPRDFRSLMASPRVVDGRRVYNHKKLSNGGIQIATIGTGPSHDASARGDERSSGGLKEWHYVVVDGKILSGVLPMQQDA
jgi:hypothetical protein